MNVAPDRYHTKANTELNEKEETTHSFSISWRYIKWCAEKRDPGKKGPRKNGPRKKGPTVFGKGEKRGPFFSFFIEQH